MLTKRDLQQIGRVVDEKIDASLESLRGDVSQIGSIMDQKLEPIKKDLKHLNLKVNRIQKTLNIVVKNYDEGDVKLSRRVDRLEKEVFKS